MLMWQDVKIMLALDFKDLTRNTHAKGGQGQPALASPCYRT